MAKKKVHELAKELDIQSKDIVGFLKERGSEIKNHMSVIDEGQIDLVQKHFNKGNTLKEKNMKRETGANSSTQVPQLNSNDTNVPQLNSNGTNVPQLNSNGTNVPQLNSNGTNVPQLKKKVTEVKQQGNIEKAVHEGEKMSQNPVRTQNEQMTEKPSVERRAAGNQQASGEHRVQSDRVQGDRPVGQYGDRRPQGDRPQGQHGDRRPQGDRPQGQYGDRRPQGDRPQGQYGDRRPQGDRPQGQYGDRRPQGDRPQGQYGDRRPQGDRPAGQYGDRRPQGDRPAGGQYGDRRPQGDRPAGGQYGDRRPQGDRPQGQYGDRRPQGDRPSGQYGNRPQGDRPSGQYGNRPQGDRPSGQYGNRPQGDRPSGQYGNRPQGDRPSGQYGNRPQGGNFGSRTSGGNRQGGTGFGGGGFDKDKDFGNNNRSFDKRKNDPKSSEKSSLKTDLANELTKEQRAAAFNDRNRDKNRSKQRDDIDDGNIKLGKGKKDPNRKGAFIMPKPQLINAQPEEEISIILIPEIITIKELADKMKKPASVVVKKLFLEGKMVSINQEISFEEAEEIALGYDIMAEKEVPVDIVEELLREEEEDVSLMQKRPPVVCVMGHVDHGKTSLLDSIREANVTSREAGGITQHIGAYVVEAEGEKITFLDTPGHEAFTSMRMRGAKSTDIAILVVAADDGVMPQTVEAISHAKAAGVQIIVAVNKIDKPSANVEKVKQELTEYGLVAEEWGGDTVFVPVSAHTKEGINQLLEMILITADMCELKANPNRKARGIVIEAQLDKGKGTVATVLVQKGTLCVGDNIAVGSAYGKVRAMMDDKGNRVKEAGISTPVEILGLNEVPNAGEVFISTENDKEARNIAEAFIKQDREKLLADTKAKLSLDGLFTQIKAGNIKELNIIIKADVQGSVEAMKQSLLKLSNEEVAIRVIHGGVGTVNESDVTLAATSSAIIIGFNVRTDNTARETAEREKVDLRLYRVIYNAIEDVEAAMKGMLDPVYEEKVIAHAEVRQIFKASDIGLIAGSYVLDGKIVRGCQARITREGTKIYEGNLASLKRFKDDVKEVAAGYECGLVFEKFQDIKEFDIVELYTMVEVPR